MGCCSCFQTEVVLVGGETQEDHEEYECSDSLKVIPRHSSCSPPSKIVKSFGSWSLSPADIGFPDLFTCPIHDTPLQASVVSMSAVGSSLLSSMASPPLTEVTPQLFFGSWEDAKNEYEMQSREITHIISLVGQKHLIAGIEHKHHPMNDYGKTDLDSIITKSWAFVEQSQRPGNALFIHCMWGQNRSATIMIVILMKHHGWSLQDAFRFIKRKRPLVQINEQYAKQLAKMEKKLLGRSSVSKNWMEIRTADMDTGKVNFFGDSMLSYDDMRSFDDISIREMLERNSL